MPSDWALNFVGISLLFICTSHAHPRLRYPRENGNESTRLHFFSMRALSRAQQSAIALAPGAVSLSRALLGAISSCII